MQPSSAQDYKQLLSEVIKKQIVILGPDITLSKARNVKGITVADDGTVTNLEGSPQEVTQALIDQFVQLSGLIVKKTMEPLLSLSQSAPIQPAAPAAMPAPAATAPVETITAQPQPAISTPVAVPPVTTQTPVETATPPIQTTPPLAPEQTPQPVVSAQPAAVLPTGTLAQPQAPTTEIMQPVPSSAEAQLEPAKNPLAA